MSLKDEIGGIIYDADIYKAKVTTGQLNSIVDDIMKEIKKSINEYILKLKKKEDGCIVKDSTAHDIALYELQDLKLEMLQE